MSILSNGWGPGTLNNALPDLLSLARMIGYNMPNPTLDDLQEMYELVADRQVFAEAIEKFMAQATKGGRKPQKVQETLRRIDRNLGLTKPISFRSTKDPSLQARAFDGVAILAGGTATFMHQRLEVINKAQFAGARFRHIIVLGGARVCESPDDRRHPYIQRFEKGREPNERELITQWIHGPSGLDPRYVFPDLPATVGDEKWLPVMGEPREHRAGKRLSTEEMLAFLVRSGWFERTLGANWMDIPFFAAANSNALFMVLYVMRVLGLPEIWFAQAGAELKHPMPADWWQGDQNLMTTPSGIIRFWKEARLAGYINDKAKA